MIVKLFFFRQDKTLYICKKKIYFLSCFLTSMFILYSCFFFLTSFFGEIRLVVGVKTVCTSLHLTTLERQSELENRGSSREMK